MPAAARLLGGQLVAVIFVAFDGFYDGDEVVHLALSVRGELLGCIETVVEQCHEHYCEHHEECAPKELSDEREHERV